MAQPTTEPAFERPEPKGKNNYLVVVFDSCRYDTFMEAAPKFTQYLGEVERRWSYASWTAPSHYNLLTGLLPHHSPSHVYASEYYKRDFLHYNDRLGADGIEFKNMVPEMYLPTFLRRKMGFSTHAMVSLPVLNPKTCINRDFDSFELMKRHNDMRAMLPKLHFSTDRPSFHLLNVGETHYPYALPDEDPKMWPQISGVHGVFKHLDDFVVGGKLVEEAEEKFFDQEKLDRLRGRQLDAVRYLDGVMQELFDLVPKNTYVTVIADHGELFGEEGYFGHGPINHDKVYEVPFVEGKVR
ncbi:MAG: LTA synthase family protein [Deltaproteobacteria bacterium]|nr:LTA synthase family protein [Deltaproteobacteria bacterium]OIP65368.1 MAG: metalloenzyme [Nitrospirae bacterium CG2_30_70_394]PIW83376.1 MAG: metalloenzyme [Nitrospirae bacterium CG_4_8_14_3_um_filter_70_85]PIX83569.1 MAG: metalloenzyme [Nitrospirae bacterium CG_4_10_14_3_um_filter_70_108]PJB94627.1 MAG: metalloenzyme [Nitrospirae bacterium CG_4_9_14_0_8_um_filter_70_14]HBB41483.1 metalloenzyme [Pseudomonadota bacterium]